MNYLKRLLNILIISVLFTSSCVTTRTVIETDSLNPLSAIEEINEKVQVGDWVNIKIKSRTHENLLVEEIEGSVLMVKQYYGDTYKQHKIYLQFINELEIVDIEAVYPIGLPFTALLVIFYLLV